MSLDTFLLITQLVVLQENLFVSQYIVLDKGNLILPKYYGQLFFQLDS